MAVAAIVISVVSLGAQYYIGKKQQAKARRRARRQAKDAAGISDRISPSGAPVNLSYGRDGVPLQIVWGAPARSAGGYGSEQVEGGSDVRRTRSVADDGRRGVGSINATNVERSYKEFFIGQWLISAGEINRVKGLIIDDIVAPGKLGGHYIIEFSSEAPNFGTASPLASNITVVDGFRQRGPDAKFTGLSYLTGLFYKGDTSDGDQPKFAGAIPNLYAMIEGNILHSIELNDARQAVVTAAKSYVGGNFADVLYDYCVGGGRFYGPPDMTEDDIDLDALYLVQQRSDTNVFDATTTTSTAVITAEEREAVGEPAVATTEGANALAKQYARARQGVIWPVVAPHVNVNPPPSALEQLTGMPDPTEDNGNGGSGQGGVSGQQFGGGFDPTNFNIPDRVENKAAEPQYEPVKFGEYHGSLPTDRDYEASIEQILEVVPGSRFFMSLEGKYKLVMGDHTVTGEAGSVADILDEDTEGPGIQESAIDYNERLNQIKVSFSDQEKNFATSTYIYPSFGSTLYRRWVSEDGGRVLRIDETIDGCKDRFHAAAIARSTVALSRRKLFEFRLPKKFIFLEEGDIVRLFPVGGDPVYARMLAVRITEGLQLDCIAQEYVRFDYRFWYDDEEEVPGLLADRQLAREPKHRGFWKEGREYVRGDLVIVIKTRLIDNELEELERTYRCVRTHFSRTDNKPGTRGGRAFWARRATVDAQRFDFVGDNVADVVFVKDAEISTFELPQATRTGLVGDEPLLYSTSTLPAGLIFNPATRTITGTPSAVVSFHRVTYQALLESTNETAELTFVITVRERGSAAIPLYEFTAVDVEQERLEIHWQVLKNAGSIQKWRLKITNNEDEGIVDQVELPGATQERILTEADGLLDWEEGEYTATLMAIMQDGVVAPIAPADSTITFYYFGDATDFPPAPTLEITDIMNNELAATWDEPTLEAGERVSKYEIRLRLSYNSYMFDMMDRRTPGTVTDNEWAFIEGTATSAVLDRDLTFSHIRDSTQWLRLSNEVQPGGDQDQQAGVPLVSFFTVAGASGFSIGDFVGLRIGQNWCQWVFAGIQAQPGRGTRVNLRGTGTGADWEPEVVNSQVDENDQQVPLDSTAFIQFQGKWQDSNAINETSKTVQGETTYTPPEAEYVFNIAEGTRLLDGLWYDVSYRYAVTTSTTDSQGQTVETTVNSEWSEVATILMTDEVAKPPAMRNLRFEESSKLVAKWEQHPSTSFDAHQYQIQWKSGDDDYPSSPQISVPYNEDAETFTADITTSPVTGTRYTMQGRMVARLSEVTSGSQFLIGDWTDEVTIVFGVPDIRITDFLLQTGDNPGELKFSFTALEGLAQYQIRLRQEGTTNWIEGPTVSTLTSTSNRNAPVALHAAGTTVTGVINRQSGYSDLTPGVRYEADIGGQVFSDS